MHVLTAAGGGDHAHARHGERPQAEAAGRPLTPSARLREELTRLFQENNLATDGGTMVAGEYLDVQARVA
ncbi:MAG: hypothetical protein ABI818_17300 [Acidobacteriota bacterium]